MVFPTVWLPTQNGSFLLCRQRTQKGLEEPVSFSPKLKGPFLAFGLEETFFRFTDLRAAGLPAELKHIIQRRKRKQP